jgi:hypothetical protein
MMALAAAEGVRSADAAEVKLRARQREPIARLACARRQFRTGRFTGAVETLRALVDDYPRLAGVSRTANALLIDAEVAQVRRGRTGALPPPAAVGATSGSAVELMIRNASPAVLELLLSGGLTSRRATVPSCSGCPEYGEGERPDDPCATRYPGTTIRVPAGSYGAVVRTPKGDVRPFYGTWELSSGTQYAHCFWIGTRE